MSPSRRPRSSSATCASIAPRRRRRALRWCARICGRRRAPRCRTRSKPRRASREAAGAKVTEVTLPPLLEDAYAAQFVIQDYETFRALAFEYDRHRDLIGKQLREQLDRAAAITADDYDAARRTASRARQVLADTMADHDVILTPSAPGAAPHGLGCDRQSDVQPAVDADGRAVRQRAGLVRERACRSASRSSAASAATAPRSKRRCFWNRRSRARPAGNAPAMTVRYVFRPCRTRSRI